MAYTALVITGIYANKLALNQAAFNLSLNRLIYK